MVGKNAGILAGIKAVVTMYLIFFSVLIFDMVNINRYNTHKWVFFGNLNFFKIISRGYVFIDLRARGRRRDERERRKEIIMWHLSFVSWRDQTCNLDILPWLGIELTSFWYMDDAPTTWVAQPRQGNLNFKEVKRQDVFRNVIIFPFLFVGWKLVIYYLFLFFFCIA